MIKCRPLIVESLVIFGNYDPNENLWAINVQTGQLKWSAKIGIKSIAANPCRLNDSTADILVCALDGTIARVDTKDGHIKWARHMETPIFASPTVVSGGHRILIAEVGGIVHCLNASDGQQLWQYKAEGNLFSAMESIDQDRYGTFGCYAQFVYCIRLSDGQLKWRCHVGGQVRAVPKVFGAQTVLTCTTNGWLRLINWQTGALCTRRLTRVDGDIFSTPAIQCGRVCVGSRNDMLYCLDLSEWLTE